MDATTFTTVLRAISGLLPFGSKLDEAQCLLAWQTIPPQVRDEVSNEMWVYAAGQRKLDPAPLQDLTLDVQLLRYLYRLENGMPNFEWGLKQDLASRMAQPHKFNAQPVSAYDLGEENDQRMKLEGWGRRHEPNGVLAAVFDGNGSMPGRLTAAAEIADKWFNLPVSREEA